MESSTLKFTGDQGIWKCIGNNGSEPHPEVPWTKISISLLPGPGAVTIFKFDSSQLSRKSVSPSSYSLPMCHWLRPRPPRFRKPMAVTMSAHCTLELSFPRTARSHGPRAMFKQAAPVDPAVVLSPSLQVKFIL